MHHAAAARLDPRDWVDEQRRAGAARGNIFAAILAECGHRRAERFGSAGDERLQRRLERIAGMKQAAAQHDATPGL